MSTVLYISADEVVVAYICLQTPHPSFCYPVQGNPCLATGLCVFQLCSETAWIAKLTLSTPASQITIIHKPSKLLASKHFILDCETPHRLGKHLVVFSVIVQLLENWTFLFPKVFLLCITWSESHWNENERPI